MKVWKKLVGWTLAGALFLLNATPVAQSVRRLPDTLSTIVGQEVTLSYYLPLQVKTQGTAVEATGNTSQTLADVGAKDLVITPKSAGTSTLTLSLFGMPVKTVQVQVSQTRTLVPGGGALGIRLQLPGAYVVAVSSVATGDGFVSPAGEAGLRSGDVITAVNGQSVKTTGDLSELVAQSGGLCRLSVQRGGQKLALTATPAQDGEGVLRLGAWVRDSATGIGTLTYYEPGTDAFGALGHPIADADTGDILPAAGGVVYPAKIVGVRVGQRGNPGELHGTFVSDGQTLGSLAQNTAYGIFGTLTAYENPLYPDGLPVGARASVELGEASILSTIDGGAVTEYACEITQVFSQSAAASKSMVVKITDERLLQKTGGIVQGMSGSPILQNGHIIGAVTHVLVNNPTTGYGIFIETMLDAAG